MRNSQVKTYLREVGRELTGLSRADRAVVLDELEAAMSGLTNRAEIVTALGEPAEYAATVRGVFADEGIPGRPQRRLFGVPVEFRGLWNRQVRARIWDPGNPQLLVPRLFGIGWALNMGAIAVRLGLVRADDCDDDVLDAIPEVVTRAVQAVPVVLTAAQWLLLASCWHRLPRTLATSFGLTGRARGSSPRWVMLVPPLGSAAAVAWSWAADPGDGTDRLLRPAMAMWLATLAAGSTLASVFDGVARARGHSSRAGLVVPASILVGSTLMLAGLVLPVRAGLDVSWADARQSAQR